LVVLLINTDKVTTTNNRTPECRAREAYNTRQVDTWLRAAVKMKSGSY